MTFTPRNYFGADTYLRDGRNKDYRAISGNTYLARVSEDRIALVLHNTAVVTYCLGGETIIYTGGWFTITTRRRVEDCSPLRVLGNHNGHRDNSADGWIVGHDGTTEPKVQTCRTRGSRWEYVRGCQGTGRMIRKVTCYGPDGYLHNLSHANVCPGNVSCKGKDYGRYTTDDGTVGWGWVPCQHGETEPHTLSRCEHDHDGRHHVNPCEHGQWKSHQCGTEEVQCYGCKGTGEQDYGSKPVPVVWESGAIVVNDAGEVIRWNEPAPEAPPRRSRVPSRFRDWRPLSAGPSYFRESRTVEVEPVTSGPRVAYKAPCPACGEDCEWLAYPVETPARPLCGCA